MKARTLTGTVLATTVGLMFMAQPLLAQDSMSSSEKAQVKCVGGNACKGKSSCKSAQNDCKGQNSCKGKGFVMAPSAKECTNMGGHAEGM